MPRMSSPSSSYHRRPQPGHYKYPSSPRPSSRFKASSVYSDDQGYSSDEPMDRVEAEEMSYRRPLESRHRSSSYESENSLITEDRSLPSFQEVIKGLDKEHINLTPQEVQRVTHWQRILHPSPAAPSLSVFNCPNATYAWPNLQPASHMKHEPVIYVDYTRSKSRAYRATTPNATQEPPLTHRRDSRSHESSRAPSFPLRPSMDDEPTTRKHRISSILRYREPEEASLMYKVSAASSTSMSHKQGQHRLPPIKAMCDDDSMDLEDDDSLLGHEPSRSESNSYHASIPTDPRSSSSARSRASSASCSGRDISGLAKGSSDSGRSQNWQDYARKAVDQEGNTIFECLWMNQEGDESTVCGYAQKKQLVKRHVETTHLHIKRFICPMCHKPFPQKTSLNIHISGHTGEKPHVCAFNCGMSFKDPARKHKHEKDVHNKISKKRKEKPKVARPKATNLGE